MRRQFNVNCVCVGQMMFVTLVLRVSMIIGQGVRVETIDNEEGLRETNNGQRSLETVREGESVETNVFI